MSGSGSGEGGLDDPLNSPASALVTMLRGVGFRRVHLWEPREIRPPAVSVGTPSLRRRGPDEAESQLSTFDYWIDYPCSLYCDLSKALESQQEMVNGLVAIVAAVDADPSLGGTVLDAVVSEADPFVEQDRNRPLVGYQFTVSTLSLITPDSF